MKKLIGIGILTIIVLLGCTQPQNNSTPISPPEPNLPTPTPSPSLPLNPNTVEFPAVCIEGKCVHVQLATTETEKQRGLMGVTSLADTEGMLFIWNEEDIYPFWMKDTLIPLDIVWIDAEKQVVDITTMQPCVTPMCPTYSPRASAQYVLETRAGLMEEWDAASGNNAQIIIPQLN